MRDFNHSVGVLVNAYMNNTLVHGECNACAVGNLIRGNGYVFDTSPLSLQPTQWLRFIQHTIRHGGPIYNTDLNLGKQQIEVTGYTPQELNRIEIAFEQTPLVEYDDNHMFDSLMSVVDVLAEIHGIDLTEKEKAKALFVKA